MVKVGGSWTQTEALAHIFTLFADINCCCISISISTVGCIKGVNTPEGSWILNHLKSGKQT